MLKNYLKIALRNIKREKGYSLLNIGSLSIGIICCILIMLFVRFELSYDKHHQDSDRIYRAIPWGDNAKTPCPLGPTLIKEIPEIETAARFIKEKHVIISYHNKQHVEKRFFWADPEILKVFTIPLLKGNPKTALSDPYSILISETTAKKYFGNEDPVGKVLTPRENIDFKVAGVFVDTPDNSHFQMDIIAPYKTLFIITGGDDFHWTSNFSYTFFKLREGANLKDVEQKFVSLIDPYYFDASPALQKKYQGKYPRWCYAQPLTRIHLHSHLRQELSVNGNINNIYLFFIIGILILIIACINYINLVTARAGKRSKEIGIRKVSGALRKQLILQFLSESVVLTVLAMIISIGCILLFLPVFNNLFSRQLSFNPFTDPQLLLGLLFITLFVGLFAGGYPSLSLSGFKPITVLKGALSKGTRGKRFRNILVIAQFSITIILIICTLIIKKQMNYINNCDLGYSKDQIVTVPIKNKILNNNSQDLISRLNQNPNILSASSSGQLPNNIEYFRNVNGDGQPHEDFSIHYNTVDYNYVGLFDIEIVKGRNFSKEYPSDEQGVFLLNETAVKTARLKSPIGSEWEHWTGARGRIVGVIKDFHLQSLHNEIEPLYLFLDPARFSNLSIKIKANNMPATLKEIKNTIHEFAPNYPVEYTFFDEEFKKAYQFEQKMMTVFSSFSLLAIIIACIGLLGLVSYSVEQKIKEIGIRKILGASVTSLFSLLSREFLRRILIANLIAWPVAFLYSQNWLQSFAYRIPINIGVFFLSSLIALIISLITIGYHILQAIYRNPVDALRHE